MEALLNRINPVSVEVEELWGNEAERRIDAFEKGEISAIDGVFLAGERRVGDFEKGGLSAMDGEFAMRSLKERLRDSD